MFNFGLHMRYIDKETTLLIKCLCTFGRLLNVTCRKMCTETYPEIRIGLSINDSGLFCIYK